MVKKTRRLVIGGRKKTRSKRGGEKRTGGKTKHFVVKKGDSFGGIVDIYLSKYSNHGKKVTEKHLMDDIFKKVNDLAVKKTHHHGLQGLYDGLNFLLTMADMRTEFMRSEVYMAPQLSLRAAKDYKKSCDGKDTMWKWTLNLLTSQDINQMKVQQPGQGIDPGLLFAKFKKTLLDNWDQSSVYYNHIVVPIGIPRHSMCGIFTCVWNFNKNIPEVTFYLADPNGYRSSDTSNPYLKKNTFAQMTMDCKNAILTECEKAGIIYGGDMLCDTSPQTLGLKYVKSDGFCGGFTAFLCFLFLNNPTKSVEDISNYILGRERQWHENSGTDWEKITKRLWEELTFEGKSKDDLAFYNPLMALPDGGYEYKPVDVSKIKDKKVTLWDESIKSIGWWISDGTVKYKGKKVADKEHFRRILIDMLGDDAPLDWYECHIIMFLVYLDEFNTKWKPLSFYAKDAWAKNKDMLYDHGKKDSFVEGRSETDMGEAGVRKYPSVHCDMKSFPSRVPKGYNTVCFGRSPEMFEKAKGRKPNGSTHNS